MIATSMDWLIERSLGREVNGTTFGQRSFTDLDFANDLSVFAELLELLVPALEILRHSTETALLIIYNDALLAADCDMVTLVLLDFSSAFDTVEHTTLLDILRTRFGITDPALNWHKRSCLTDLTV